MTRQSTMKDGTDAVVANDAPAAPVRNGPARPKPSKKEQLIRLLSAKAGADAATIGRKLGWQKHTVRAALSGLRKAGYDVEGERPGEGRAVRYRILAAPAAAEPASRHCHRARLMAKDLQSSPPADLAGLGRGALKAEWEKTFGSSPPLYLSLALMRTAIGYERQCRTFGGLSPTTRRALASALGARAGQKGRAAGHASAPQPTAAPGALLVREWNGRTYRVEVLAEGYRFDGRTWPSLTAIARRITGTNWSGPRFFGLTPKRRMKTGKG